MMEAFGRLTNLTGVVCVFDPTINWTLSLDTFLIRKGGSPLTIWTFRIDSIRFGSSASVVRA